MDNDTARKVKMWDVVRWYSGGIYTLAVLSFVGTLWISVVPVCEIAGIMVKLQFPLVGGILLLIFVLKFTRLKLIQNL